MLALLTAACAGAPPASPTPEPSPTPVAVSEACAEATADLYDALSALDSRLSVGMNFGAYSEAVGDVRVAYDRIPHSELEPTCIDEVGIPLENAMNAYLLAYNRWNECIGDTACSNDEVRPTLQGHWSDATDWISQARTALP